MGVLYGNDYDYQRALESMGKALDHFEKAGKERLQYIAKRNIGLSHLNMLQFPQAEPLLKEVLTWGEAHNDTYIIDSTLAKNTSTYSIIAHCYAAKGNKIATEDALAQAWTVSTTAEDTANLWDKSYLVGKLLGDKDMALRNHEHLLARQDSVLRITLRQPLLASQLTHYQNRLEVEELRNLNYRYLMGIAALVIIIVAVVLWMLYREAFRKKEVQIKQYIDAADQLRITINFFSSDEGYTRLEAIVNDGCNDVIARLRRELPKFKEADFRLLCYFCAGFSIQTICLFTQEESKKLWVYKSRLITRIKNSDAPSKDIILAQIPQRMR